MFSFFFVIPNPSFVQLLVCTFDLSAGEVWCSAVQAGNRACPTGLPREQGSPGLLWAWTGAGQDGGHTGEPGSAEPVAVGRQRLTELQICWGRDWQPCGPDMGPKQWQGAGRWWRQGWPQRVMVVPSEPDKLSVLMPLLLPRHPCSLCHARLTVSRPLLPYPACTSVYSHKHLSPHGMAAGNRSTGNCCACAVQS